MLVVVGKLTVVATDQFLAVASFAVGMGIADIQALQFKPNNLSSKFRGYLSDFRLFSCNVGHLLMNYGHYLGLISLIFSPIRLDILCSNLLY